MKMLTQHPCSNTLGLKHLFAELHVKGNVGKVGKISNFGAVGDGSVNGNVGKVGKISNFGAVSHTSLKQPPLYCSH